MQFKSEAALTAYARMLDDIEETFGDFVRQIKDAIPGDRALERASAIFEMNKNILEAKHRAVVSAVELDLEAARIEIYREHCIAEVSVKSGMN